jgi:hypothetical protein
MSEKFCFKITFSLIIPGGPQAIQLAVENGLTCIYQGSVEYIQ